MRIANPIAATDIQTVLSGVLRFADLSVLLAASLAAYWLRLNTLNLGDLEEAAIALGLLLALIYLHVARLYEPARLSRFDLQMTHSFIAWTGVMVSLLAIGYFTKTSANFSRIWIATWYFGGLGGLVLLRLFIAAIIYQWRRAGLLQVNTAILGAGEAGTRLARHLLRRRQPGLHLIGIFGDSGGPQGGEAAGIGFLGTVEDLLDLSRRVRIDEVLIALPWGAKYDLKDWMARLNTLPVTVKLYPENVDPGLPIHGVSLVGGLPMLDIVERPLTGWSLMVKTISDRILALLILLFALPVMGLIALIICLDSPGPAFYRQKRYGFASNEITVLKFRTMYVDPDEAPSVPQAKRNDPRITRVGAFLRRSSLDELPQLFNVLSGQMSLVGPRPHAVAHNEHFAGIIDGYLGRHKVKPGITGWAQVNGLRGETDTLEKMRMRVQYDLYYIDHWSLLFDFKILFLTLFVGFIHRNAR